MLQAIGGTDMPKGVRPLTQDEWDELKAEKEKEDWIDDLLEDLEERQSIYEDDQKWLEKTMFGL